VSHIAQLALANDPPQASAQIRQRVSDFQVKEQLSFSPAGEGQHVYLNIEKQNLNTEQVATQLAKFAGIKSVAIGYAGMKDRNAVTTQWFSVDLAGKPEPNWQNFNTENIQVIESCRHTRKLKRGAINHNHFHITLRDYTGDLSILDQRLHEINHQGVPNYFGEQRFGRNESNLAQVEKLICGQLTKLKRHQRSLYLSAARSMLFNLVLSRRVQDKTWNRALPGEVVMLQGSHSVFKVDNIDRAILNRIDSFDIHPTGPMWGRGELATSDKVRDVEMLCMNSWQSWCEFLEQAGLNQERRALRVKVADLDWHWLNQDVELMFNLPSGSYATSVLRELVQGVSAEL